MKHKSMRKMCALWALSLLVLAQPLLANPPSMVHVHYTGTSKLNYDGLTIDEAYKKMCADLNKIQARLGKVTPFRVSGSLKDLETYTEDVYVSPENGYHATHRQGYALGKTTNSACEFKVIPQQKITIVYYKQRSSYRFDSTLPIGEQWGRDEVLGKTTGKAMVNTIVGLWDIKVQPTGKKDRIANLNCDVANTSFGNKNEMVGTACVWRSEPKDRLIFLGHPLELSLSSELQMGKGSTSQHKADSVNLREAYDSSVFAVPKAVVNMPFYADEPNYTKSESDESDLDCKAEKKKTGIDPCANPVQAAKWCAIQKKNTGKDPCVSDDMDDEGE